VFVEVVGLWACGMKIATYSGIKRRGKSNRRGPGRALGSLTHRGMKPGYKKGLRRK